MCLNLNNISVYGILCTSSSRHQQLKNNQIVSDILAPIPRHSLLDLLEAKPKQITKNLNRFLVNRATDCWEYTGPTTTSKGGKHRYGTISVKHMGIVYKLFAHRLAYAVHNRADPLKYFVCHHCDNPLCINPDHLFLGTAKDNMRDMVAKGRAANQRGANNNNSKASLEDIDLVVELLPKLGNTQIAARLNHRIGQSMISRIRLGKSWAKYTGIEPCSPRKAA